MDSGIDVFSEDGTCLYSASYWANRQLDSKLIKKLNLEIYQILDKYVKKMKNEIESHFNVKVKSRGPVSRDHMPISNSTTVAQIHFQPTI